MVNHDSSFASTGLPDGGIDKARRALVTGESLGYRGTGTTRGPDITTVWSDLCRIMS